MSDASRPNQAVTVMTSLQSLLLNVADINDFLQQLTELATSVVDPPASCGITAHFDGHPLIVACSDHRATHLNTIQLDLDDGPCVQATRTGQAVYISDTITEPSWPAYIAAAREHGLRSSLSLPLTVVGRTVGALGLFAFDIPDAFGAEQQQRAAVFAAQAAVALQLASLHTDQANLRFEMKEALTSRAVIDQALGIVMAQRRCTAASAFLDLKHQSQNANRKLRDVAADLVHHTSGQPADDERSFTSRG